jgi:hypothetical protein
MRVFLSYRIVGDLPIATLVDQIFVSELGAKHVFRDARSISPGVEFESEILRTLVRSDYMVCLIGPGWIDAIARLQDPADFVRQEFAEAARFKVPLVPLLFGGVELPPQSLLPAEVAGMLGFQATKLHQGDEVDGIRRLIKKLVRQQPQDPEARRKRKSTKSSSVTNSFDRSHVSGNFGIVNYPDASR